jgi:hypothetical protein
MMNVLLRCVCEYLSPDLEFSCPLLVRRGYSADLFPLSVSAVALEESLVVWHTVGAVVPSEDRRVSTGL